MMFKGVWGSFTSQVVCDRSVVVERQTVAVFVEERERGVESVDGGDNTSVELKLTRLLKRLNNVWMSEKGRRRRANTGQY